MDARTPWQEIVCVTAFVVAFYYLYVGKIVFNHVGGALYWLSVGAALWVWNRQRQAQETGSRRKVVVESGQ